MNERIVGTLISAFGMLGLIECAAAPEGVPLEAFYIWLATTLFGGYIATAPTKESQTSRGSAQLQDA